ncbi:MAG: pH regulation protein F [Clostridiales bacterium]|nr:pH regulation protein F [Clostridiales bacterium]
MIIKITIILIIVAIAIFTIRLVKMKDVFDKLLNLNLLAIKIILLLAVYAAYKNNRFILDVAAASSLVGFIATAILIIYFGRDENHE